MKIPDELFVFENVTFHLEHSCRTLHTEAFFKFDTKKSVFLSLAGFTEEGQYSSVVAKDTWK